MVSGLTLCAIPAIVGTYKVYTVGTHTLLGIQTHTNTITEEDRLNKGEHKKNPPKQLVLVPDKSNYNSKGDLCGFQKERDGCFLRALGEIFKGCPVLRRLLLLT